jgi:hypothetical protein
MCASPHCSAESGILRTPRFTRHTNGAPAVHFINSQHVLTHRLERGTAGVFLATQDGLARGAWIKEHSFESDVAFQPQAMRDSSGSAGGLEQG